MSKQRCFWVVEFECSDGRWVLWSRHDTRKQARNVKMNRKHRVVKYVPADTYKKVGAK